MEDQKNEKRSVRPYFIPASVNYGDLPPAVQAAIEAIVEPSYREFVLGATGSLERSAGVSLCFLLCLEILEQFELGNSLNFGVDESKPAAERDQQITRHLRLLGAKQQSASFLMKIRIFRASRGCDQFHPPAV